jgi:hypothetical protein
MATTFRVTHGKNGPRFSVSRSYTVRSPPSPRQEDRARAAARRKDAEPRAAAAFVAGVAATALGGVAAWLMWQWIEADLPKPGLYFQAEIASFGIVFVMAFIPLRAKFRAKFEASSRLARARQWNALRREPVPDKDVLTLFEG